MVRLSQELSSTLMGEVSQDTPVDGTLQGIMEDPALPWNATAPCVQGDSLSPLLVSSLSLPQKMC